MKTIQRRFLQNFLIGITVLGLASAFLFTGCNTTNKGNTDNDGQDLFYGEFTNSGESPMVLILVVKIVSCLPKNLNPGMKYTLQYGGGILHPK